MAEPWKHWQAIGLTGGKVWTDRMVVAFHSWVLQNYRMSYTDLMAQVGSERMKEINLESFWLTNIYPTMPELSPGYDPDLEPTPAEKRATVKATELYKQQATSHIKMLDVYLYTREKAGKITGEGAEEVLRATAKFIKQGTPIENLPFFREVSSQPWDFGEEPIKRPRVPFELPAKTLAGIKARVTEPQFESVMAEMEVPGVSRPWTEWFQSKYGEELARSGFGAFDVSGAYGTWAETIRRAYMSVEAAVAKSRRAGEAVGGAEREVARGVKGYISGAPTPEAGKALTAAQAKHKKARSRAHRRVKSFQELLAESPTQQAEQGWADYLRKRVPELKQEYAGLYPWGKGGQPEQFAPMIRTV